MWLALIYHGASWLAIPLVRLVAAIVPSLFVLELFLFALHWAFVSEGIADARRSLATFLVNLLEIGLLFAIIQILAGCATRATAWGTLYSSLAAVLRLGLPALQPSIRCDVIAHSELVIAFTFFLVVIAGLVGLVVPPQKKADSSGGAA